MTAPSKKFMFMMNGVSLISEFHAILMLSRIRQRMYLSLQIKLV